MKSAIADGKEGRLLISSAALLPTKKKIFQVFSFLSPPPPPPLAAAFPFPPFPLSKHKKIKTENRKIEKFPTSLVQRPAASAHPPGPQHGDPARRQIRKRADDLDGPRSRRVRGAHQGLEDDLRFFFCHFWLYVLERFSRG